MQVLNKYVKFTHLGIYIFIYKINFYITNHLHILNNYSN